MISLLRAVQQRLKLAYLWVTRILLADDHFGINPVRRIWYAIAGGYTPDQIGRYQLTRHTKGEYLSEFDWYRSRSINAPFDNLLNNKISCNEVLRQYALVPEILFVKNRGRLVRLTTAGAVRAAKVTEVLDSLAERGTLFIKPFAAGKGKGVHRLDSIGEGHLLDGEVSDAAAVAALLENEDSWFASVGVEQHPVLSTIHPDTTNTIRMITLRGDDGVARIAFAVLRIGTSSTIPVDNGSRGGLVANIDLETGTLSTARSLRAIGDFPVHPDTGAQIEGTVLPDWDSVCRSMLEVTDRLPYLNIVAWDLLLTEEGPVIIEANSSSGVNILQIWGPQRQGVMGDFYRQHKVIS